MDKNTVKTFRFGVLTSKGHAEVHEMKLPKLGEHQILIKQLACNICTADYGQWLGLREHQGYPMAGGHEGAGVILETGAKVVELLPGDFVAISNNYCGECEHCRKGEESQCVIRSSGGHNDSICAPASCHLLHSLHRVCGAGIDHLKSHDFSSFDLLFHHFSDDHSGTARPDCLSI